MRGIRSIQVYLWKRMECIRWVARFFEFNFSDQQINSIKLKKLGSLREFVRDVLHIPSLKRKKREPQEARGGFAEPKVQPSLLGFLLSCSLACWTVDDVQHVWGRDLECIWNWWFWEISPHLFLYMSLFKENKSGDKKGLYWFWTPGSLNFIESNNITIWSTSFYFIYIFCIWILMFLFTLFILLYIFFFMAS